MSGSVGRNRVDESSAFVKLALVPEPEGEEGVLVRTLVKVAGVSSATSGAGNEITLFLFGSSSKIVAHAGILA